MVTCIQVACAAHAEVRWVADEVCEAVHVAKQVLVEHRVRVLVSTFHVAKPCALTANLIVRNGVRAVEVVAGQLLLRLRRIRLLGIVSLPRCAVLCLPFLAFPLIVSLCQSQCRGKRQGRDRYQLEHRRYTAKTFRLSRHEHPPASLS